MSIAIIQTTNSSNKKAWLGQDMLLSLASMDLNPQLVLTGAGLELWHRDGDSENNRKSLHKRFAMLQLFECPAPWVNENEFKQRGWSQKDLIAEVTLLDEEAWQKRIEGLEKVLVY